MSCNCITGLLPDHEIRRLCLDVDEPMIYPYSYRTEHLHLPERGGKVRIPSYGQSPAGYDVRISAVQYFTEPDALDREIDVLEFDSSLLISLPLINEGPLGYFLLPPRAYALASTYEGFTMPPDVSGTVWPKSTYARAGLHVNNTVFEPGWRGIPVLEIGNETDYPMRLYQRGGIAQIRFTRGATPEMNYSDLKGRYQHQEGITLPR